MIFFGLKKIAFVMSHHGTDPTGLTLEGLLSTGPTPSSLCLNLLNPHKSVGSSGAIYSLYENLRELCDDKSNFKPGHILKD